MTALVAPSNAGPKWNLSTWISVATSVRVVNTNTVGTAMRASDHLRCAAADHSNASADQYEAPRKTAVIGGAIVQAK